MDYKNKIKTLMILFIIVNVASLFLSKDYSFILSTFIPFFYGMIIAKVNKVSILCYVKKVSLFLFCVGILQIILITIKMNNFEYTLNSNDSFISIVYSIDLLLIYLFIGKVVQYARNSKKDIILVADKYSIPSNVNSIHQSSQKGLDDLKELSVKQLIYFYVLIVFYQLLQLLVVLCIGIVNDMVIEIFIMLPIFWLGKSMIGGVWHSDTLSYCSFATFVGFYILTKINLPLEISIFSTILLSGAFVFILHKIMEYLEELNMLRSWFTREEQLRKLLMDNNCNNNEIEIAIRKLVRNEDFKTIATEMNLEYQTVKNYFYKTKKLIK